MSLKLIIIFFVFCIIQACVQSYGENCQYPCSQHCYNQTCDRFNGRCLYCCTEGFNGDLCNESKPFYVNVVHLILYLLTVKFKSVKSTNLKLRWIHSYALHVFLFNLWLPRYYFSISIVTFIGTHPLYKADRNFNTSPHSGILFTRPRYMDGNILQAQSIVF